LKLVETQDVVTANNEAETSLILIIVHSGPLVLS
jgi:hypothetical protein